jgi:hypothetical protein
VAIETRHGVDPVNLLRHPAYCDEFFEMKSDDFFHGSHGLDEYDICFCDGLHHADQTMADIINCACRLSSDGSIVVHDLLPDCELHQEVPRRSQTWTGDVWKCWYVLLKGNYGIKMTTHLFDWGVGVIENISEDSLDNLLCDFTDNLDRIARVSYEKDFEEYKLLIGG